MKLDGTWSHESEIGMTGTIHAPQYGLPRIKKLKPVVEKKRISLLETLELAKLLREVKP